MVVIRLARHGSIHKPFYHVTVADRRARRDGTFIERVGFYNPIAKGKAERLRIDLERVDYWVGQGAQTSQTVSRLVKEARRTEQIGPVEVAEEAEEKVESAAEDVPETVEAAASGSPAETQTDDDSSVDADVEEAAAEANSVDATAAEAVSEETPAEAASVENAEVEAESEPPEVEATAEEDSKAEATTEETAESKSSTNDSGSEDEKPAT